MSCWQKEKNEINAILCGTGLSRDSSTDRKLRAAREKAFHAQTSRTVEVTICVIPERTARSTVRFTTTWVSRSKSARLCNHCKLAFPGKGIELLPGRKRERGEHRYCEALIFAYWAFALCTMPHISEPYIRLQFFFSQHDDNTRHVCAMVLLEHPKPVELPPTSMMECSFRAQIAPFTSRIKKPGITLATGQRPVTHQGKSAPLRRRNASKPEAKPCLCHEDELKALGLHI